MYLNAMNSFLAVQLEALWKVHLKMIVFKWIFLLGYIRKDFNYQTDALSKWREPNFLWGKIFSFNWKKNYWNIKENDGLYLDEKSAGIYQLHQ